MDKPYNYKQSEGARFKIKFDKNPRFLIENSDISPFEVTFEKKDGGISWKSSKTKSGGKWDEILYMVIDGQYTQKTIADILNVTSQYVTKVKGEAKKKGLLDKNGNPTKEGKEWFEDKNNNK